MNGRSIDPAKRGTLPRTNVDAASCAFRRQLGVGNGIVRQNTRPLADAMRRSSAAKRNEVLG